MKIIHSNFLLKIVFFLSANFIVVAFFMLPSAAMARPNIEDYNFPPNYQFGGTYFGIKYNNHTYWCFRVYDENLLDDNTPTNIFDYYSRS